MDSFFLSTSCHSNRIITPYPEQIQSHPNKQIPSPCLGISSHAHAKIESRLGQRKKGREEEGREKEIKDLRSLPTLPLSSRSGSSTTRFGSHFVLVTSPNLAATFSCLLLPPPRRRIMKIRRRRAEPSRIIVAVFLRRIISAAIHRPRGGLRREGDKEGRRKRGKRPIVIEARSANARTQFSTPVNS